VRYPGFGAIVSFEITGDAAAAERVCDSASLITNATSLGGVETTWERRRRWALESESVPENLIRLSVGCEHVEDLWRDIDTALSKA
jgi:cystathionine gamma-synthase